MKYEDSLEVVEHPWWGAIEEKMSMCEDKQYAAQLADGQIPPFGHSPRQGQKGEEDGDKG